MFGVGKFNFTTLSWQKKTFQNCNFYCQADNFKQASKQKKNGRMHSLKSSKVSINFKQRKLA